MALIIMDTCSVIMRNNNIKLTNSFYPLINLLIKIDTKYEIKTKNMTCVVKDNYMPKDLKIIDT
jgi:hypothetical protein